MSYKAGVLLLVFLIWATLANGQCPLLGHPDNGMVYCSFGSDGIPTEGDTCVYECNDGYIVFGDGDRVCQSDNTWTGSEPICEKVECEPLTHPDNGMISCTGNMFEDTCTLSCDGGYELSGSEMRTCQSNQIWNGTDTTCIAVGLCPVLTDPDNGMVNCSLGDNGVPTEGDTCVYQCNDGYVISGSYVRECQSDGMWSGNDTTCEAGDCPVLTSPENGNMSCTGSGVGDTCTFSCDDGYDLSGSDTRTCQDGQTWSGTDVTCLLVECPKLTNPDNGMVKCSLGIDNTPSVGDTCVYECDDGFTVSGDRYRECQSDSTWTGSDATCARLSCAHLVPPINGTVSCTGHEFKDTCNVSCDTGFELSGSRNRTCLSDLTWSGGDAVCAEMIFCPSLDEPDNGTLNCSIEDHGIAFPNDTCDYTCDNGFVLEGSAMIVCAEDGVWSDKTDCVPRLCERINTLEYGSRRCNLGDDGEANPGDTCNFSCDEGFEIGETQSQTCDIDGIWRPAKEPECVAEGCEAEQAEGFVTSLGETITVTFWTDNPNATYDCRFRKKPFKKCTSPETYLEDVVKLGENTIRVRTACPGQVNDRPTTDFSIVVCAPLTLDNGVVDCEYGMNGGPNEGDVCNLICDDGYLINGSNSRECKYDGNWTRFDGECYESGCTVTTVDGEITADNFTVTVNFSSDVPSALFECNLNQGEFVSCTSPHTFGSDEVIAGENQVQVRAKCADQMGDTGVGVFYITICEPLILDNGTIDCEFVADGGPLVGDECSLACNDNFVLNGSSVRTCLEDGTWSGDDGFCFFSECEITTVTADISSNNLTITLNFTSDDPQAFFECKINNRQFVPCTSPFTYEEDKVNLGENQVRVRARCPGQTDGGVVEVLHIVICKPLTLENGFIDDCEYGNNGGPNSGDTCFLECFGTNAVSGSDQRTCLSDGTWSGDDGECIASDCVVTTLSGEISSQDLSITVTFTSDDPDTLFECRLNDEEFKRCLSPHIFDSSVVTAGPNQVQVLARCPGQTTGHIIETFNIDICDPLVLDNGMIDCDYGDNGGPNAGDACSMMCNEGFVLNGTDTRLCMTGGIWSGETECYESDCGLTMIDAQIISQDLSITVTFTADELNTPFECRINDEEFVSCTSPHTFVSDQVRLGNNQVVIKAICPDGSNSVTETLEIIICEPLSLVSGTVDCEYGDNGGPNAGDTCNLACSGGLVLNGSDSRTCMDDGTWSGDDGVCYLSDCVVTQVVGEIASEDLVITVTFTSDDPETLFECKLNNRDFVACTSPATFDQQHVRPGENQVRIRGRCPGETSGGAVDVLQIDICETLSLPNGMIDCEYGDNGGPNEGDVCMFSCDDGYVLGGSDVRTCMDSGIWSGVTAVCSVGRVSGIRCQSLTAPDNGKMTCSLGDDGVPTKDDMCSFTCDDGYELTGSSSRECQIRNGQARWIGRRVICTEKCVISAVKVAATVTDDSATVEFSSDLPHPMMSFQCRLDAGRYRSCTSPVTYSDLPEGRHIVTVRGRCPGQKLAQRKKISFAI